MTPHRPPNLGPYSKPQKITPRKSKMLNYRGIEDPGAVCYVLMIAAPWRQGQGKWTYNKYFGRYTGVIRLVRSP